MDKEKSQVLKNGGTAGFLRVFPENVRSIILTAVLGLAAGLAAVAFLFMVNFLFNATFGAFASRSKLYFVVGSLLVILATSIMAGVLLHLFGPSAAGSGIPQVKAAFWKELGYIPFVPVLVKFVAGVLSIGGGTSLGREGPSIYIGSGVASNLSGVFGLSRRERRGAAVIGASAGLAAAFNTPLAAITFAIEEIIGDLNSRFLGRVVLASVLGAFAVYALLGKQPAFFLPAIENVSPIYYTVVPLVAVLAGLAGVVFQRLSLSLRGRVRRQKAVPVWLLPVFGGLATWIFGVTVYLYSGRMGVFSLGYADLSDALIHHFPWKLAGIMVLAKLLATIAGYGFGGCGGIFAPTLFIGGMVGCFCGGLAGAVIPLTPSDHIVLAVVGMSACLGAVVRAPLTSILIVFEMTHQFELIPGLMIGTVISQMIGRLTGKMNFYEELLIQDGHELHKIRPPLDLHSWQNLAVSAIANPKPVIALNLSPEHLKELVDRHPFQHFPYVAEGKLQGMVSRQEILNALISGDLPAVQKAVSCTGDQSIQEIGDKFIESPVNVLVVVNREGGEVTGIITLHDLIRAQAAIHA